MGRDREHLEPMGQSLEFFCDKNWPIFHLPLLGDGTQKRDFLYVTDVARAFFLAGTTELTGQVWNLGGGNPQSVNRLVELLDGDVVHIPKRPGEPDCTWADIEKIKKRFRLVSPSTF